MASITSAGIGSGLDIESLITKLMTVERQPLDAVQTKIQSYQAQISTYGRLSSTVDTFRGALSALNSSTDFKVFSATSSSENVANVSTSISATPGQHAVEVIRLAENHSKRAQQGYADKNVTALGVANDRMTISVGANAFTVEFGGKTLEQIQAAINGATDNTGVTAAVVKGDGGTPYQLMLTSAESGSEGFLQVSYGIDPFQVADASNGANTTWEGAKYYADDATTAIGRSGDTMTITTAQGSAVVDIGDKTLSAARDAINAETATTGVTASIEQDDNGYRLVLSSASAISSVAYNTTGSLASLFNLSDLNVDRATVSDPGAEGDGIFDAADLDGIFEVNGITATRSTNTVSDVVDGLTFNLKAVGTTTINVARDTSAVSERVKGLVDAYNRFAESMDTFAEGALKNDQTLRSVIGQVRNLFNSPASGLTHKYLSEVGVNFVLQDRKNPDGSVSKVSRLAFDSSKLDAKLNSNYQDVAELFSNKEQGFATRLDNLLNYFTQSKGFIATRTAGLGDQIDRLQVRGEDLQVRISLAEQRYRKQFSTLDQLVATLRSTSSFLTEQLAALPKVGG